MNPIASAPLDGTVVRLSHAEHPEWGSHAMSWDAKLRKWTGRAYTPMGSVRTYWDTTTPPTHWEPLS